MDFSEPHYGEWDSLRNVCNKSTCEHILREVSHTASFFGKLPLQFFEPSSEVDPVEGEVQILPFYSPISLVLRPGFDSKNCSVSLKIKKAMCETSRIKTRGEKSI